MLRDKWLLKEIWRSVTYSLFRVFIRVITMKRITISPNLKGGPRLKACLQRGVVVLGSTVSALLIAEVILRWIAPTVRLPFMVNALKENERGKYCQYDATLGWTGRPNVDEKFVGIDCSCRVRQNRYGFRGAAYPFQRSPRNRLLVLGDSFVWGYGVDDEDLFTTRLERGIKPPVEVVNLGVSGYGTDQELLLYRQLGRQFQADRVLLVVTPYTDLWDNMFSERYGYPKPLFKRVPDGDRARLELTNMPVPRRSEPWENGSEKVTVSVPGLCRMAERSSVVALTINTVAKSPSVRAWLESKGIMPAHQAGQDFEVWTHLSPIHASLEEYYAVFLRSSGNLRLKLTATEPSWRYCWCHR